MEWLKHIAVNADAKNAYEATVATILTTTPAWSPLLGEVHSFLSWVSMFVGLAIGAHTIIGWFRKGGDR